MGIQRRYGAWAGRVDDSRIASSSADNTAQMWDATTGAHVFTYHNHTGIVTAISWSPDGKRIATASADATVQVWNPAP